MRKPAQKTPANGNVPSDDGLDINNGKAVSGRVAFSPMLGVEVAGSSYYGNAISDQLQPPEYHGH